jgi:hypothetical protein
MEKERIRGKWWLLCRWEGDTAKQQARAIGVRKAAKVLELDVSCLPPIQLEGSARQFFGLKPNNHPSFGTAVTLAGHILEGIQAGPIY